MPSVISHSDRSTATRVVRLHWQDDRDVLIRMEDNDLFTMHVSEAIEACRAYQSQEDFKDQFQELLRNLAEWVRQRTTKLQRALLTVRDTGVLFLIVQRGCPLDEELSNELTDLDLHIANATDFSLIRLDVMLLPEVSNEGVLCFQGQQPAVEFPVDGE